MDGVVSVVCPNCGKDIPSKDLSHFIRFYDGDMGWLTCPNCETKLTWQFRVTVDQPAPAAPAPLPGRAGGAGPA